MTTRMLCRIGENDLGHSSYGNKQPQDLSGLRQEEFLSSEVHFAKLPKAAVLQALAQYARYLDHMHFHIGTPFRILPGGIRTGWLCTDDVMF